MVVLENSTGSRTADKSPIDGLIVDYRGSRTGHDSGAGIYMRFDIGSSKKREFVRVDIEPEDFTAVLTEMIACNRKAFLEAVAKALLAYPE